MPNRSPVKPESDFSLDSKLVFRARMRPQAQMPRYVALVAVLTFCAAAAQPVTLPLPGPSTSTTTYFTFLPMVSVGASLNWAMVAANPERTSWTAEEVRGPYNLNWYRPIEPYIPYKVQPIAANGALYISTAGGLYAFSAHDGSLLWVHATALPLGNSPTIGTIGSRSVAYVGGYDREIHAIDALSGQAVAGYTAFVAGAGFETNPLVIQDSYTAGTAVILAGNRDGYFYALDAVTGALKWKYQTAGPISLSAAYKNGVLYFASQDMYAYALNVATGDLVWKSAKLPGQNFTTFWPVIYADRSSGKDYVVLSGGEGYRQSDLSLTTNETSLFNAQFSGGVLPTGHEAGNWSFGTATMNASIITGYYADKPFRRRVFFLDRLNGQEYSFTDAGSGKPTYAPFSWSGVTHGGNKYPGVVNGIDGVYYQQTAYDFGGWVTRGGVVGWKMGTPYVSEVQELPGNPADTASDEPTAYSSGGKLVYAALCCDRMAGAFDITIPFGQPKRAWGIWGYDMASNGLAPGYQQMYNDGIASLYNGMNGWQIYSGKSQSKNGVYGKHGTGQAPPIPYQGKLFVLRGNALLAFSPTGSHPTSPLPLATVAVPPAAPTQPTRTLLQQRLATEVQKMLLGGPIRPGYVPAGFYQQYGIGHYTNDREMGELFDYFQNPADTVITLLRAYAYLTPTLQSQVQTYVTSNYGPGAKYDFAQIVHIGWNSGASRDWADLPPDVVATGWGGNDKPPLDPSTSPICAGGCNVYWHNFPPYNFYAAWKYAQVVGNNDPNFAKTLFNVMKNKLEAPMSDSNLIKRPYFVNSYAAGYLGYLQLKQLAGLGGDSTVQLYYDHMLALRTNSFAKDTTYWNTVPSGSNPDAYNRVLSVAENFMFLTPELGDYLQQHIQSPVQTAVDEYNYVAPYWFVANFDDTFGEGAHAPLYDVPALFQAKAYILKQPFSELVKYLDAPAFRQGDLFYIQNLVAALSAN